MRKLTEKKMKLFGKEISVLLIAVIAFMGLGAAALVPYLSNTITGNVVVGSPLELHIRAEGGNWETDDSLEFSSIHGGESVTFYTQETNHRDEAIPADLVMTIVDNDYETGDVTSCQEFVSINARTTDDSWNGDLMNLATCDDETTPGTITLTLSKNVATGTYEYEIIPTFALNAVGDYTVTVQFMDQ